MAPRASQALSPSAVARAGPVFPGKLRPSDHIVRAVLATAVAELDGSSPIQHVRRTWPDDRVTPLFVHTDDFGRQLPVMRSASVPADTTTWAADVAVAGMADLLLNLGPASAASQLLSHALTLRYERFNALGVPMLLPSASNTSFVGQGAAIPARQVTTGLGVIELKKFATILGFARELIAFSSAESMVRQIMIESIGRQLDAAMLDVTLGSSLRPPGLRAQVNALPAASAGDAAMMTDLATLANAVAGVGGLDLAYVADPASAVKMQFKIGPQFNFPIFASKALADKTVICVALPALCAAINPTPQIGSSKSATVQMDDAPAAWPASNIRSGWQTDSIFVRFVADVAWCLRADNAVSWITNHNW